MPLNKTFFKYKPGVSINAYKATAIENELKMLEKARERQKIEIQALIQHNINKQHNKKEIEEKVSPLRYRFSDSKMGFFNNSKILAN